jgi:hypothetical protein
MSLGSQDLFLCSMIFFGEDVLAFTGSLDLRSISYLGFLTSGESSYADSFGENVYNLNVSLK